MQSPQNPTQLYPYPSPLYTSSNNYMNPSVAPQYNAHQDPNSPYNAQIHPQGMNNTGGALEAGTTPLPANPFLVSNEGVANGFGQAYYNMRDPACDKSNTPVRQESAQPKGPIISNIVFLVILLVMSIVVFPQELFLLPMAIMLIAVSYIIYLCMSFQCNQIKPYLQNMKRFETYRQTYDKMVQGRGFFRFTIQCYHYTTHRTRKGGSRRSKVVTHTAEHIFPLSQCVDQSGVIMNPDQSQKKYVFLHYCPRYYFSDDRSQQIFIDTFNNFVRANIRDSYQSYGHTFVVEGLEENVAYTAEGNNVPSMALYYLFIFLGLGGPYLCLFESAVSRFQVGILKRLTV